MILSISTWARRATESSYRALLRLLQRLDDHRDAHHLQLVRGWRHDRRATVIARVVTRPVPSEPERISGTRDRFDILQQRYFRFGAAGALAQLDLGDRTVSIRADRDGFLEVTVPVEQDSPPRIRVLYGPNATAPVPVPLVGPHPDAQYAVVSDIDDTILDTELDAPLRRARTMLVSDTAQRAPFSGLAEFYEGLHAEGTNPFFYLSNSPWNLYEHLDALLDRHHLPTGPILLRRVGSRRDGKQHKRRWLDRLLRDLRPLPFVLLGDTTRRDGAVYIDVASRWPDRVRAVFLRTFDGRPIPAEVERRANSLGVPLVEHRDVETARAEAKSLHLI